MKSDGFGTLIHPDELVWIETPGGNAVTERPILGISDWRAMKALYDAGRA